MKQKLTPWHDGNVKPVHVGWYEKNWFKINNFYDTGPYFAYWDGNGWSYSSSDLFMLEFNKSSTGRDRNIVEWRGLAEKPD